MIKLRQRDLDVLNTERRLGALGSSRGYYTIHISMNIIKQTKKVV